MDDREIKRAKPILESLFYSQDPAEPTRNPLDPLSSAYFNAKRKIHNQAFVKWYQDGGGEYLVKDMQQKLIGMILNAIVHDRSSETNRNNNLKLLDDILRDANFIDRIYQAFVEQEAPA